MYERPLIGSRHPARRLLPIAAQRVTQLSRHGFHLGVGHVLGAQNGVHDGDRLARRPAFHPDAPVHAHRDFVRQMVTQRR